MLYAAPVSSALPAPAPLLSAPVAASVANMPPTATLTYFSTPPAQSQDALLNQRRPSGIATRASVAEAIAATVQTTPATLSSAGLQAAASQPVRREYGYSSAFVAQWLTQSSSPAAEAILSLPGYRNLALPSPAALTAFAEIKFMPSRASIPQPTGPMTDVTTPLPEQAPPPLQLVRQDMRTPTPGDILLRSATPFHYETAQVAAPVAQQYHPILVRGNAPALATAAKVSMASEAPRTASEPTAFAARAAAQSYAATQARVPARPAEPVPENTTPIEAITPAS